MISFNEYKLITEQVNLVNKFHTLGIPRSQMPQIRSDLMPEFIKWLESQGHKVTREAIPISKLKLTQADIDIHKVIGMIHNNVRSKPVIVSKDSYITDGHHRVLALQIAKPKEKSMAWRVSLPIQELLTLANSWDKSFMAEELLKED